MLRKRLFRLALGIALLIAAGALFWAGRLSAQGLAPAEAQSAFLVAIIASVTSLLVSLLNAWVTSKTASGRFLAEKWWEKKDKAYEQIIQHLAILQHVYWEQWADAVGETRLSKETKRRLDNEAVAACDSLARIAARGAYPISGAAAKALDGLIDDLDKEDLENWQSNFETWAAAAKRCRETIIEAAGAELGQHRS